MSQGALGLFFLTSFWQQDHEINDFFFLPDPSRGAEVVNIPAVYLTNENRKLHCRLSAPQPLFCWFSLPPRPLAATKRHPMKQLCMTSTH